MICSTLGVIGSGVMGAGIAQAALASGLNVVLYDVNSSALDKAKGDIIGRIARMEEKGKMTQGAAAAAERRLTLAGSFGDFTPVQVVIEAILERVDLKQAVFRDLERAVSRDVVLATNTSSLSVAAIASACEFPGRVCGLHFFNPVPLMTLVELISAPGTSLETADRAEALVRALGKTPVRVKDGPGFLVNLGGRAYTTEALHIVQEGVADVAAVDRILRDGVGFRMGPFELMDLTGIDVNFPVTSFIHAGYQFDPRLKTTSLHELMFNSGRFGRKSGFGYYRYPSEIANRTEPEKNQIPSSGDFGVSLPQASPALTAFCGDHGLTVSHDADVSLIAPIGEDATTVAAKLGLEPSKVIAIDLTVIHRNFVTLMAPLGHGGASLNKVKRWLQEWGLQVEIIKDSPGFVVQRVLAMIANLGCEMAQIGVGTPEDIDIAMKLGLNYPCGPLEFGELLGLKSTHTILTAIQHTTGSDRYRPSLWLRRRALSERSVYERD